MKYMMKNLSDKITAVFIYLLLAELVVALILAIDCMVDYHFYDDDCETYAIQETYRVKTIEEFEKMEHVLTLLLSGEDISALLQNYSKTTSNVVMIAQDTTGNVLLDTSAQDGGFDPAAEGVEYSVYRPFAICNAAGETTEGVIHLYLRAGLPARDSYHLAASLVDMANVVKYPILVLLALFILLSIWVLGVIMSSISRKDVKNQVATPERFIDKIPFDLLLLIMVLIVAFVTLLIVLTSVADIKQTNLVLWNAVVLILTFIISSMMLLFVISLATRIKYGHVYRNTLVYKLISAFRKKSPGKKDKGDFKVRFISKVLITIISLVTFEVLLTLIFLFQYKTHENGPLSEFKFTYFAIVQLIVVSIIGSLFYMMIVNIHQLRVSSKKLAEGKLEETGNTAAAMLFGDFKEISDDFENIKGDMLEAMAEKERSLEMRNELIANISHDIKTPLTSIINYADLVSSGGCSEEELRNYLGVISHQSERLNDLLQSLIDVSKLSSGTVKATFESLDIGLYLSQVLEEFSPAFAEKQLEPEVVFPDQSLMIRCDSSMLWRVFQNLLQNICKYAMPQTRVYMEIEKRGEYAVVSFKNTSAQRITLSEEELIQRFRRNDKARTTSGNGLGISIAKQFTELQEGVFELFVDGDLFKTELSFRLSDPAPEAEIEA